MLLYILFDLLTLCFIAYFAFKLLLAALGSSFISFKMGGKGRVEVHPITGH